MTHQEAKSRLKKALLYGILDTGYSKPDDWPELGKKLVDGGVDVIQIRAKEHSTGDILPWARMMVDLLHPLGCPVIINDYPELVGAAGAAGVHVGQDDYSVEEARERAGLPCLVGKSTHSLEQARQGESDGADYIGFGPIYATPTKPGRPPIGKELIRSMSEAIRIPAFCIGGIKAENVAELVALGAERVVIVSGLLAADNPAAYAEGVHQALRLQIPSSNRPRPD
jgi:thiamine-phosphate pyrophosphorylase